VRDLARGIDVDDADAGALRTGVDAEDAGTSGFAAAISRGVAQVGVGVDVLHVVQVFQHGQQLRTCWAVSPDTAMSLSARKVTSA
jgi:hypothetical protein